MSRSKRPSNDVLECVGEVGRLRVGHLRMRHGHADTDADDDKRLCVGPIPGPAVYMSICWPNGVLEPVVNCTMEPMGILSRLQCPWHEDPNANPRIVECLRAKYTIPVAVDAVQQLPRTYSQLVAEHFSDGTFHCFCAAYPHSC